MCDHRHFFNRVIFPSEPMLPQVSWRCFIVSNGTAQLFDAELMQRRVSRYHKIDLVWIPAGISMQRDQWLPAIFPYRSFCADLYAVGFSVRRSALHSQPTLTNGSNCGEFLTHAIRAREHRAMARPWTIINYSVYGTLFGCLGHHHETPGHINSGARIETYLRR